MTDEDIRSAAVRDAISLVAGMYHDVPDAATYLLRVAMAVHGIILLIKTANFYGHLVGFTDDVTNPVIPPIDLIPVSSQAHVDRSQVTASNR